MRFIYVLLMCCFVLSASCSSDPALDRVIAFNTNVFTGKSMLPEEWLTEEARSARLFNSFGGLPALIKGSLAEADEAGGLDVVNVKVLNRDEVSLIVETEVVFRNGEKTSSIDTWSNKEDGKWKLTVDPKNNSDDFAP